MKFISNIKITLRESILDVQGKAVEKALHSIDFPMMGQVRIGKYVTMTLEADSIEKANELVTSACEKLIANPIIEDYEIEIEEA